MSDNLNDWPFINSFLESNQRKDNLDQHLSWVYIPIFFPCHHNSKVLSSRIGYKSEGNNIRITHTENEYCRKDGSGPI
jgi:hypothetical protein